MLCNCSKYQNCSIAAVLTFPYCKMQLAVSVESVDILRILCRGIVKLAFSLGITFMKSEL